MDFEHTKKIINGVSSGDIRVVDKKTEIPSPFAFGLISSGYSDVIKI